MTDKYLANKFSQHVTLLVKRPGMFVKHTSLETIEIHINAYLLSILDTHEVNLLASWSYWIAMKFNIWSTAWSWGDTIKMSEQSDNNTIFILSELAAEFTSEFIRVGTKGIEEAHKQQFFKVD
jgi:hypothetical protein